MINAPIPSDSILKSYGLAVWLLVMFVLGMGFLAFLLIRHMLKTHEKERELHQQFFSDAIKENTKALVQTANTLSEASNNIRHSMESLGRVEQMISDSRKELRAYNAIQQEVHRDLGDIGLKIESLGKLQEHCQRICEKKS